MAWQTPGATAIRWEAFADATIEGLSPKDAAIKAGYASKSAHDVGSELLRRPEVIALIDLRRSMLVTRTDWTPERVIIELAGVAREAREAGNHSAARACYRDIGEHIGMWPRQPVNVDARQQLIQLPESLTMDDLRAIAATPIYIDSASTTTE